MATPSLPLSNNDGYEIAWDQATQWGKRIKTGSNSKKYQRAKQALIPLAACFARWLFFFCPPWFFSSFSFNEKPGPKATKTSVKKCVRAALNFKIALIPSHTIRQMLVNLFLELNSIELYQSSGKEKEGRRFEFVFTSSMKPYNLILRRSCVTTAKKNSEMHVQRCCFANLNLLLFCDSRCRRCRRCLSFLIKE